MTRRSSINLDKYLIKRSSLAYPYILWALGFIIIPLVVIVRYAIVDTSGAFTLSNITAIVSPANLKALIFSLEIALSCTLICILLAYPLVMGLRQLKFRGQRPTVFFLILPMWMNFILKLLAWQMILSSNGILNLLLEKLGIGKIDIANSFLSIMIGTVYDYLPYMVLPLYNAISSIDDDMIEAAKDLGARRFTVFKKIIFPLSLPGLMSGITMVFVPSMTSFVTADILGGGKLQLVGNIIEQEFIQCMDWNMGAGLSVALMIFVLLTMAFTIEKNDDSQKQEQTTW